MRNQLSEFYHNRDKSFIENKDSYQIVREKIYPKFNTIKQSACPFESGRISTSSKIPELAKQAISSKKSISKFYNEPESKPTFSPGIIDFKTAQKRDWQE